MPQCFCDQNFLGIIYFKNTSPALLIPFLSFHITTYVSVVALVSSRHWECHLLNKKECKNKHRYRISEWDTLSVFLIGTIFL